MNPIHDIQTVSRFQLPESSYIHQGHLIFRPQEKAVKEEEKIEERKVLGRHKEQSKAAGLDLNQVPLLHVLSMSLLYCWPRKELKKDSQQWHSSPFAQ